MTEERTRQNETGKPALPEEIDAGYLAGLGAGTIAYIRPVRAGDLVDSVPQARALPPATQLFALHGASGDPIVLTNTREMALAQAHEHDLTAVSVH